MDLDISQGKLCTIETPLLDMILNLPSLISLSFWVNWWFSFLKGTQLKFQCLLEGAKMNDKYEIKPGKEAKETLPNPKISKPNLKQIIPLI